MVKDLFKKKLRHGKGPNIVILFILERPHLLGHKNEAVKFYI